MEFNRCNWCLTNDVYTKYHDQEWGVPKTGDRDLFELLVLESFQAGLNWLTILKKRENFRESFANFEIHTVAEFSQKDILKLLQNKGIIRHRGKIEACIHNANLVLEIQKNQNSFSEFLWKYVDFKPIQNQYSDLNEIPSQTNLSRKLSKDLKKIGFKFMGPTTTYAFMQAAGLVNDHLTCCFRFNEVRQIGLDL